MKRTLILAPAAVSLGMVATLGLAGPASAACVPSAGQAFIAPTYERVLVNEGSPAVERQAYSVFQYKRTTEQVFRTGEVPVGWTVSGEPFEVVDQEYVPAVPEQTETQRSGWVRTTPEGEGWIKYDERQVDATYKTQYQQSRVTQAYQAPVPAQGTPTIEVANPDYKPGYTVHHDAEYATEYLYIKQVKGIIEQRTGNGRWQPTGETFDWENWSGNSTRWEGPNFTESGPHNSVQSQDGKKRKVSTNYRYVQTGQTRQGAETKPAWDEWIEPVGNPTKTVDNPNYVPAKPEVPEVRETQWFDSQTVEGWTATGQTQQVKTADAYTEYKFKRTVVTQEYVPAIEKVSHYEVKATYTETSDWVTEAESAEYAGWVLAGEKEIVVVEGKDAVPASYDTVMTDAGQKFIAPVVCEDISEGDDHNPASVAVVARSAQATERVKAEESEGLAVTGADPLAGVLIAGGLLGLGGTLIAARKRASRA